MKFEFNDGGRKAAGYKGTTGDCVCRSIAIITGIPYKEVYDAINQLSKEMGHWHVYNLVENEYGNAYEKKSSARTGVNKKIYDAYLKSLGYVWVPTMGIGTGCQVHLNPDELPAGRLIVRVSKHLTAVIDGIINDTWDCSREETRCVYGYFHKPNTK